MKRIYVVGIGPGGREDMTPRAVKAIENSDVICTYSGYAALIADIAGGKEVFSTPMTREKERCERALQYALNGRTPALVSSGDAGVYGMAGIMHEVCGGREDIAVEVIPGVTAACSGAAVLGAPLVNDFAVISLSDLLTDKKLIEKRLLLAAQADMVICIYNPSSKKRSTYLKWACELLMSCKSPDTPCGYVRNAGREGEESRVLTLSELKETSVDMFTTVFIGSSRTRVTGGRLVTSRGYKDI